MIGVVDTGLCNLGAILTVLRRIQVAAEPVATPAALAEVERIILPGVGAFDAGMARLDKLGLRTALERVALAQQRPVLGICLGMQLMARCSTEGALPGLGWVDAEVTAFAGDPLCVGLPTPHMGWDPVTVPSPNALFPDPDGAQRFYFAHGHRIAALTTGTVLATCRYGGDFVAAFQHGNLFGVQFHPEKSHRFGMQLLTRFAAVPC